VDPQHRRSSNRPQLQRLSDGGHSSPGHTKRRVEQCSCAHLQRMLMAQPGTPLPRLGPATLAQGPGYYPFTAQERHKPPHPLTPSSSPGKLSKRGWTALQVGSTCCSIPPIVLVAQWDMWLTGEASYQDHFSCLMRVQLFRLKGQERAPRPFPPPSSTRRRAPVLSYTTLTRPPGVYYYEGRSTASGAVALSNHGHLKGCSAIGLAQRPDCWVPMLHRTAAEGRLHAWRKMEPAL
jgi:hypothetical protein